MYMYTHWNYQIINPTNQRHEREERKEVICLISVCWIFSCIADTASQPPPSIYEEEMAQTLEIEGSMAQTLEMRQLS